MSTGQMLVYGSTLIIRKKFSASAYFADVRKYEATVSNNYILFQQIQFEFSLRNK